MLRLKNKRFTITIILRARTQLNLIIRNIILETVFQSRQP